MLSNKRVASRLQATGNAYHREENYAAAIAEFTKALDLRKVPTAIKTEILGYRAAAREKIGGTENLELALLDARRMIQLSKDQAQGYHCAGKILQLLGRDESALDIYADGIKHVNPDGPQFKKLKMVFEKVQDRLSLRGLPDTRSDPLSYLPVELAESILQHLPFKELMIVQLVSRAWRSFIHASRKTYVSLNFAAARQAVPDSTLRAYISRSGGSVREAVLSEFSDDSALSTLAHQCRQLSTLWILFSQVTPEVLLKETHSLSNLTSLVTDLRFSVDDLCEILERCASLRTFECEITRRSPIKPFTANLRKLKIWGNALAPPSPGEPSASWVLQLDIVKCLPKLEKLEVTGPIFNCTPDFRSLESLSVLTIQQSRISAFPLLPESIRVLDISENFLIQWSFQDLAASPLPNLESFMVDCNPEIKNEHVLAILAPSLGKRSLRTLSFLECPNMDFNSIEWLVKHGESLEMLELGENVTVGDRMSKDVAKFKKLRYLGLSDTSISATGVMNVVNGLPGVLREVDITGCEDDNGVIRLDKAQLDAVTFISREGGCCCSPGLVFA